MKVTFDNSSAAFADDLKRRVDAYFRDNKISKYGNPAMAAKIAFWLAVPFGTLALICTGWVPFPWTMPLFAVVGFGLAGIGFNIGHDGNHGSVSERKWVNSLLGKSFDVLGANSYGWVSSHNFSHHTYTNIPEVDPDIEPGPLLSFHEKPELPWFHRFQFIYAWVLYCLLSFMWLIERDFTFLLRPDPRNGKKGTPRQWLRVIAIKVVYVSIFCVLPLTFSGLTVPQYLAGFALMHACTGLSLSVIFQLAHVVMGVERPWVSDANAKIRTPWAEHQIRTTANFGNTQFCTFLFGGLNYQIEHHLFPTICHVHYPKIAPIVKQCAEAHGLRYVHSGSFFDAVASHERALYRFGRPSVIQHAAELRAAE